MPRNGGYASACNAGAARGAAATCSPCSTPTSSRPRRAGCRRLLARLAPSRGRVGAVGPKLLFEDDSLQHAGLFFARDHQGRWLNHHFHKGMPRDYRAGQRRARRFPAVTGACLVISPRRSSKRSAASPRTTSIGDYEDSDLCLKIRRAGPRHRLCAGGRALPSRAPVDPPAAPTTCAASPPSYNCLAPAARRWMPTRCTGPAGARPEPSSRCADRPCRIERCDRCMSVLRTIEPTRPANVRASRLAVRPSRTNRFLPQPAAGQHLRRRRRLPRHRRRVPAAISSRSAACGPTTACSTSAAASAAWPCR